MPMKARGSFGIPSTAEMTLDQKILSLTLEQNIISERLAEIIAALIVLRTQRSNQRGS